jgi:hypothetical protein
MTKHRTGALAIGVLALALFASGCTSVLSIDVGQCFNDWEGAEDLEVQQVTELDIVDCNEPHDNEVYRIFDLPDGAFPGPDAINASVVTQCDAGFDLYVGTPYADSRFVYGALFPTEESWAASDREIVCFLWDIEFLKLTGSMENSRL